MLKRDVMVENQDIVTSCPKCKDVCHKGISNNNFESNRKIEFTCICGHTFFEMIERRRSFRKNVYFKGNIINNSEKFPIIVENISSHGARIKMLDTPLFDDGKIVDIEFSLDNSSKKITKKVRVKKFLSPKNIGCEFISGNHE